MCIMLAENPDVTIQFDQTAVNVSEGNFAVVCASIILQNEFPFGTRFYADISVTGQASAGMLIVV